MVTPKQSNNRSGFEDELKVAHYRKGIIFPIGVAVICFSYLLFFTNYLADNSFWLNATMVVTGIFIVVAQFLHRKPGRKWIIFTIFHVMGLLGMAVILPIPSPFIAYALLLALLAYFDFGKKGLVLSLSVQGIVLLVQCLRTATESESVALFLVMYAIICSLAYYAMNIVKIANDELELVERSTNNIALERERLSTLINNMQDAVLACDSSFRIVLYNAATLSLFDTHAELFGKPIDEYLELRDSKNQPAILSHLTSQDGRVVSSNDFELVYSKNERANLYISLSRIKLAGESAGSGYMVILRDITKQKSLEDERDEFIAVMSHELRTPVSIVEGSIGLARLAEKEKNNTVGEYLNKAHEQTVMLAEIVNSLSTLVTIQSDRDRPRVSEIQPTHILNNLRTNYETKAKEKNLELKIRVGENLPTIWTNKEYVDEILQNFITNAIKYTKQGSITVEAKAGEDGGIEFSVSDTGIGISKSDQNHVFEKFWRSEDFYTRESNGTGLGLYIVDKLAEIMHAKLSVRSELGRGSTFSIMLPPTIQPRVSNT